jgi:hypothetical protein
MSIIEKGTCLQLHLGRPGTRAKVDSESVDVNTDKEMLHVSKDLLDSPELNAIASHDHGMRAWVRSISVPAPYLKGGMYMVRVTAVPTIDEEIEKRRAAREPLIEAFMTTYTDENSGIIAKARERLKDKAVGGLFDPADYPSPARMRAAFKFHHAYLSIGASENLETVSKVLFQREKEKAASRMRDAEQEIMGLLRGEFKSLVDGMLEALAPGDDGKPKAWRSSRVQKVADFLHTFNFRNIVDDAELDTLVAQARSLLEGKDADAIRRSAVAMSEVVSGFAELKSSLDPLVGEKPGRLIDFDDEAVPA